MQIKVTEWHIRKGERGECDKCPVALALIEFGATYVSVDGEEIVADGMRPDGYWSVDFEPPPALKHWIWHFDSAHDVAPITFELPI